MLKKKFESMNFSRVYMYTPTLDNELKRQFWQRYFVKFNYIYDMKATHENDSSSVEVYMAKHELDKQVDSPEQSKYLIPTLSNI